MNEYITWKKDAIVLQPVYQMEKWKMEDKATTFELPDNQSISHTKKQDWKGEVMHLINNARFTGTEESTGILLGKTSRCSFKLKYYTMMAFKICHFDSYKLYLISFSISKMKQYSLHGSCACTQDADCTSVPCLSCLICGRLVFISGNRN